MQSSLKYVNDIKPVTIAATIEWLSAQEGGRQQPPAMGLTVLLLVSASNPMNLGV